MDLKQLFNDDDAVSPVIGVILMVAITVILAAVIASFVLGLGDTTQTTPTASFGFDYEDGSGVDITHGGGDTITASELHIRGEQSDGGTDVDTTWAAEDGVSSDDTDVTAGSSINIGVSDGSWTLRVVYVSNEGDTSSTLSEDSGPDA
jgi:flagellin-like protein